MNRLNVASFGVVGLLALVGCPADPTPGSGGQLNRTPAVTGVGDPSGASTSATIGPGGGTLTSGDGQLELIVPAGALAADTTLTATPITALGPGAIKAWRLGPEGTKFSVAASVRFKASDVDMAGSEPASLRIAFQDAKRRWRMMGDPTLDGNTITVQTTHLSDWSALHGWQLRPPTATVPLGESVEIALRYCEFTPTDDDDPYPLGHDCEATDSLAPLDPRWTVNAVPNGDAQVGTITLGFPITYTAPAAKPATNPVAVSLEFAPPGSKGFVTSHITVAEAKYVGSFDSVTASENYTIKASTTSLQWKVKRASRDSTTFVPSGSVTMEYTQKNCDPSTGTYAIDDGEMIVYPQGAPLFSKSYHFTFRSLPTATITCRDPDGKNPRQVAATIPGSMQAGLCSGADAVPYTDENVLEGSGPCLAQGHTSSNWSFKRVFLP